MPTKRYCLLDRTALAGGTENYDSCFLDVSTVRFSDSRRFADAAVAVLWSGGGGWKLSTPADAAMS